MSGAVEIFEVGPRDGLQNESQIISVADKVALINLLTDTGLQHIETASFVSPKWVPQMADGGAVLTGIRRGKGVIYTALTPNLRGLDDALAAEVDEIAIFGSASEGFSQANINCSIAESLERFEAVVSTARTADIPVRGYVSCVVDCPFDGETNPEKVAQVAAAMFGMGCYQISLGDTLGRATPDRVSNMLAAVLDVIPAHRLAGHYHDTAGHALANIEVSLDLGLRVFDASVAGLGGCPYAPGAAGNVASEAVNAWLLAAGYETGVDQEKLLIAAEYARKITGRSKV